jgi:hypothetical protein
MCDMAMMTAIIIRIRLISPPPITTSTVVSQLQMNSQLITFRISVMRISSLASAPASPWDPDPNSSNVCRWGCEHLPWG